MQAVNRTKENKGEEKGDIPRRERKKNEEEKAQGLDGFNRGWTGLRKRRNGLEEKRGDEEEFIMEKGNW